LPDDRMIHRRMLRGERIGILTDFERGVWLAYELIADDFGVMRLSAVDLQRAIWLEKKPRKTVQRGFENLVTVKLINAFVDGDRRYVYQPDWQYWQKVKHPRATIEPCPPIDELEKCDLATQQLFQKHPRCSAEFLRKDFGNISEILPKDSSLVGSLARAGARETAMANGYGNGERRTAEDERSAFSARVSAFVEWYAETHEREVGVGYIGNPQTDYQRACDLCRTFADQDLRDAAIVWFGMDDKWATDGTRTIGKFASRASRCLELAKRVSA
jgi:hypothetical protein